MGVKTETERGVKRGRDRQRGQRLRRREGSRDLLREAPETPGTTYFDKDRSGEREDAEEERKE